MTKATSVESYIADFDSDVQSKLNQLRDLVFNLCPEIKESISYGMPAYKFRGKPLFYFAAFEKHIGIYATPTAHEQFKIELSKYKTGKGSVQLPLDQALPIDLISAMIKFKIQEISD